MLNQQRILVPTSMPAEGLAVLAARPELQITPYDPALAAAEFHALLADATAVALSFTRFGAAERSSRRRRAWQRRSLDRRSATT